MKFIHLSDLHLGKKFNGYSMIEDQKYILNKILKEAENINPDFVIIAGDVYDKSMPSSEAVIIFDDFLVKLTEKKLPVYLISGNHDSAERLYFGSRIMDKEGIHIASVYDGSVKKDVFEDEYGKVNIWSLPFVKPVHTRSFFEEKISTYDDMMKACLNELDMEKNERNILITHQFISGAGRSDSEDIKVGGTDAISPDILSGFDYVALGHLHRPQHVSKDTIRYCGSPLKYSFSEAEHTKSVTVVEMLDKGDTRITTKELVPLRDLKILRGTYDELTALSFYENINRDDYIKIILTDKEEIYRAFDKLSNIYPMIMRLEYENMDRNCEAFAMDCSSEKQDSPKQLFAKFFEEQNGYAMEKEQEEYIEETLKEIMEEQG